MNSPLAVYDVHDQDRVIFDALLMGEIGVEHVNPDHTHTWIGLMSLWLEAQGRRARNLWVSPPHLGLEAQIKREQRQRYKRLRAELSDFDLRELVGALQAVGRRLNEVSIMQMPLNEAEMSRTEWLSRIGDYPLDNAELLLDALVTAGVARQHDESARVYMRRIDLFCVADLAERAFFVQNMEQVVAAPQEPGMVGFMRRRLDTVEGEAYEGVEVHDPRNVRFLWGWHAYDAERMALRLKHLGPELVINPMVFWQGEEVLARQTVQVIRETLERELRGRYQKKG